MQSENIKIVRSVYPDAKMEQYFMFGKWWPCIHSYSCGEMLDECNGWIAPLPPSNEEEAWQQAAGYVNRKMIKKLLGE